MASGTITSCQIEGEKVETVTDFLSLGSKNHCVPWLQSWNKKMLVPCKEIYNKNRQGSVQFSSVQFNSVAQSSPTLGDPMNRSTWGLPVHHQLPEFIQTHVRWVSDAIQPSHPLSSPYPPAHSPSQNQGLFQWVNTSHEVAKVLEFQLQHQSFQRTSRTDLL